MNDAQKKELQRQIDGAMRYAAADKSDPFALHRALAHIRVGICRVRENGEPAGYDAEPFTETRTLDTGMVFSDGSNTYQATVYRNIRRP